MKALGVSAPSVHRMLRELESEIVSAGNTRLRRHALRRSVRGMLGSLPVVAIDEHGRAASIDGIVPVHPQGCQTRLDPSVWPQLPGQEGWWDGLPYPVYDMRPQGYLGRMLARAIAPELGTPDNPDAWNEDDILYYLARSGVDQPGNLVVGEQAIQAWSRRRTGPAPEPVAQAQVAQRYAALADAALVHGAGGSSAAGEFPKFTAARQMHGASTPHVIVKFSGSDASAAVRRWSDLLVCEHLALQALGSLQGHAVAASRILSAAGRTFLESERFDRRGDWGRSSVVTLSAVEMALIGSGDASWPRVLSSAAAKGFFEAQVVARVEELHWFGRFIANTDMHHGNLSLRPQGTQFGLAPAYDMLPMLYAPLGGGEVPQRVYDTAGFPLAPAGREQAWSQVATAALGFWREAAGDARITDAFRGICAGNADALQRWLDIWAGTVAPDA